MKRIPLLIDAASPELQDYASEVLDDVVADAVVRKFRTRGGFVLATIWQGAVHEVIYQTPARFFWSRRSRNRDLLQFYGDGLGWSDGWPIDFGKSFNRDDGEVRAIYSKLCDYITFITREYDSHRTDVRWAGKLDAQADASCR